MQQSLFRIRQEDTTSSPAKSANGLSDSNLCLVSGKKTTANSLIFWPLRQSHQRLSTQVTQERSMQVQINSDNTISMHNKLSDSIGAYILNVLNRFDPYLTRVEVHLTGENVNKSGPKDKRCVLEARAKRHQSLIVTNKSTDIEDAFSGAAAKMHRHLESTYGRLADKRRRAEKMKQRLTRLQPLSAESAD